MRRLALLLALPLVSSFALPATALDRARRADDEVAVEEARSIRWPSISLRRGRQPGAVEVVIPPQGIPAEGTPIYGDPSMTSAGPEQLTFPGEYSGGAEFGYSAGYGGEAGCGYPGEVTCGFAGDYYRDPGCTSPLTRCCEKFKAFCARLCSACKPRPRQVYYEPTCAYDPVIEPNCAYAPAIEPTCAVEPTCACPPERRRCGLFEWLKRCCRRRPAYQTYDPCCPPYGDPGYTDGSVYESYSVPSAGPGELVPPTIDMPTEPTFAPAI